ncbi:hypothetical protein KAU45_08165, partial [bacterium]|nr:hypothetical protein [bacterium]
INTIARRKPIAPHPVLEIDSELHFAPVNEQLLGEIERLDPYGVGNPEPIFHTGGVVLADEPRVVGKNHLKLLLSQSGVSLEAIAFGRADVASYLPRNRPFDIAYHLERNTFRSAGGIQLRILDFDLDERETVRPPEVVVDDRREASRMEDLPELIGSCPTVIYTSSDRREAVQRFLALRGYLPAGVPGHLDGRHYLFWETLAIEGTWFLPRVCACICDPFENPYDAILLRELGRITQDLRLVLLYRRHGVGESHPQMLDRERLAEIYRNLPKDEPFDDDIIGQLSDRWLTRGEARLALSIFLDLGLLTRRNGFFEMVPVGDRRDLSKSFTYRRLVRFEADQRRFLRQQMEFCGRELYRLFLTVYSTTG